MKRRKRFLKSGGFSNFGLKNLRGPKLGEGGWTLVELMLTVAMVAIITPMLAGLFLKVSQGMAADEMRAQISRGNEAMMARLENRLSASKHFYQGGPSNGVSWVNKIQFAAGSPPTVAGSLLPQVQNGTSMDPTVSGFASTMVGNSLFFLAYDFPQTFSKGATWTVVQAPLTITGGISGPVTNSGGSPISFIIDLYRFYYYYLTPSTRPFPSVEGVQPYGLVEWQSAQYADYQELTGIPDSVAQDLAVSYILAAGITTAVDPSADSVTAAFYTMSFGTPVGTSSAGFATIGSPTVTQAGVTNAVVTCTAPATYLCQVPAGIVSRGFSYGISPNTSGWADAPPASPVPLYATASGLFPGGFEVAMAGPPGAREVLIRCGWVAKGAAPKIAYNNLTTVQTIKDNW